MINRILQAKGQIAQIVDRAAAAAIAACTPVPGGIGSVTTALLLRHTVQAAEKSRHF